ncbi:MAG: SAP domain-containing protein [Nitrospirae bacterium]|nr:SAP domain-containing protein [Nitrospirota bacterium]
MKLSDIKDIAKNKGVKVTKTNKIELIRAIQKEEGNYDCFATPYVHECNQSGCLWRKDCRKEDSMEAAY